MNSKIKDRTATIRIRTWALTASIIISLVLYFLVNVGFSSKVNPVDLVFIATLQIVIHCLYFPDGELMGQNSPAFIQNKACYNEKASAINNNHKIGDLRTYCEANLAQRRQRYINNVCGTIGISAEEYAVAMRMSKKELFKAEKIESNGNVFHLTYGRKRALSQLLYRQLPVEANNPETILSAVENDINKAIKDDSVGFKTRAYIKKIIMALVFGTFLAYISYSARDGIDISLVVKIATYITSMLTTAVTSYSKGEICQRVYKNKFYVDLSNFIDGFFEWSEKSKA